MALLSGSGDKSWWDSAEPPGSQVRKMSLRDGDIMMVPTRAMSQAIAATSICWANVFLRGTSISTVGSVCTSIPLALATTVALAPRDGAGGLTQPLTTFVTESCISI